MACASDRRSKTGVLARALACASLLFGMNSAATVRADAPAIVPVHGYLTGANGAPVSGKHRVIFFIYDAETDGTLLHTDRFNNLTLDAGQFTVYLGSQEDQEIDLAIFRDNADTWLEVVIDNETITPRTRLGSVPYAAACGDAVTVGGRALPEHLFDGPFVQADQGEVDELTVAGDLTVQGTLDPGTLHVQEFHLDPRDTVAVNPNNDNLLADVPGLTATFTVAQRTPVMITYAFGTNVNPPTHLVTQLVIDDVSVGNTITGDTGYWGNHGSYVGTVAAGAHTVKVLYRTPGVTNWGAADWTSRRLDVLVMGR